jgi:hypothetical protein
MIATIKPLLRSLKDALFPVPEVRIVVPSEPRVRSTYVPEKTFSFNEWHSEIQHQKALNEWFEQYRAEIAKFVEVEAQCSGQTTKAVFEAVKTDLLAFKTRYPGKPSALQSMAKSHRGSSPSLEAK